MSRLRREILPLEPARFAQHVAEVVGDAIVAAVTERGVCRMVLTGGRSPGPVYRELAAREDIVWDAVELYIGDERCVPPAHADSNVRMISETLLAAVPSLSSRLHRWRTEAGAETASREYDALVAALPEPKFDVTMSGVGPDGHTASLFPGDPRVVSSEAWAMTAIAPARFAVRERVTLTLRAMNSSRLMILLCAGKDKHEVRDLLLANGEAAMRLPVSHVRGIERTILVVDPS
jgi:6-phosphogluconolactonase